MVIVPKIDKDPAEYNSELAVTLNEPEINALKKSPKNTDEIVTTSIDSNVRKLVLINNRAKSSCKPSNRNN